MRRDSIPVVPVSWGELIDKLTILEIKRERIPGQEALANIDRELNHLRTVAEPVLRTNEGAAALKRDLGEINGRLWDIENAIRAKEAAGTFDEEFVTLARAVYTNNDKRGNLKRQINLILASSLMEEKSYFDS